MLAIVWSVKYFRTYLYGRKFVVQTDHKPLVWLDGIKEPNMKLQRWKISLNEYDFIIEYLKGKENCVADGLSRFIDKIETKETIEDDIDINLVDLFNNEMVLSDECDNEDAIPQVSLARNHNEEVMSTDATIHSAMEDETRHIYITEKPVNLFKNQIYLSYGPNEKVSMKIRHKKVQNLVQIKKR